MVLFEFWYLTAHGGNCQFILSCFTLKWLKLVVAGHLKIHPKKLTQIKQDYTQIKLNIEA